MPYHESIQSSRWFTIEMLAGAVVAAALGARLLRDEGSGDDGGAMAGPVLIATGVVLALVARGFATLASTSTRRRCGRASARSV